MRSDTLDIVHQLRLCIAFNLYRFTYSVSPTQCLLSSSGVYIYSFAKRSQLETFGGRFFIWLSISLRAFQTYWGNGKFVNACYSRFTNTNVKLCTTCLPLAFRFFGLTLLGQKTSIRPWRFIRTKKSNIRGQKILRIGHMYISWQKQLLAQYNILSNSRNLTDEYQWNEFQ